MLGNISNNERLKPQKMVIVTTHVFKSDGVISILQFTFCKMGLMLVWNIKNHNGNFGLSNRFVKENKKSKCLDTQWPPSDQEGTLASHLSICSFHFVVWDWEWYSTMLLNYFSQIWSVFFFSYGICRIRIKRYFLHCCCRCYCCISVSPVIRKTLACIN